MKKALLLFLSLGSCGFINAQDIVYAKQVVNSLASTDLKGRGYVGDGNKMAAEYINGEFSKLGLLPVKKTYNQKFNVPVNTFPGEVVVKINNVSLLAGKDFLIDASSPSVEGTFQIHKTSRKDIDTEDKLSTVIQKAKRKYLLIDNTDQSSESAELSKKIDDYITFLKYSPDVAINGVIIYTKEKLTWESSQYINERPVIIINKELNLPDIKTIDLAIESKFEPKYETQNVIGFIKGKTVPDSFIVVTAHYDHLGLMGNNAVFQGANDNASGVAMLLNLAKYYSKNQPKYSMLFIAFSGEELGLLGSKYYVENQIVKISKFKFLVNFDLAGTGEEGIKVVNGSVFTKQFEKLSQLNAQHNLLPKVETRGEACISDHCLFYQNKVPCFYIYTQGGIKAYHDIYDKPETLPLTEFFDYCKLMILFFDSM